MGAPVPGRATLPCAWPLAAPTSQTSLKRLFCNAARSQELQEDEAPGMHFCSLCTAAPTPCPASLTTLAQHHTHPIELSRPDFAASPQLLHVKLQLCSARPPPLQGSFRQLMDSPYALCSTSPCYRAERDPAWLWREQWQDSISPWSLELLQPPVNTREAPAATSTRTNQRKEGRLLGEAGPKASSTCSQGRPGWEISHKGWKGARGKVP